ncbi:MAG: hypothetical protein ACRDNS_06380 [Trebonia sp.]
MDRVCRLDSDSHGQLDIDMARRLDTHREIAVRRYDRAGRSSAVVLGGDTLGTRCFRYSAGAGRGTSPGAEPWQRRTAGEPCWYADARAHHHTDRNRIDRHHDRGRDNLVQHRDRRHTHPEHTNRIDIHQRSRWARHNSHARHITYIDINSHISFPQTSGRDTVSTADRGDGDCTVHTGDDAPATRPVGCSIAGSVRERCPPAGRCTAGHLARDGIFEADVLPRSARRPQPGQHRSSDGSPLRHPGGPRPDPRPDRGTDHCRTDHCGPEHDHYVDDEGASPSPCVLLSPAAVVRRLALGRVRDSSGDPDLSPSPSRRSNGLTPAGGRRARTASLTGR